MSKMSLSSKVFKNSLLGIVPSEWNIYSVGSLGKVVTGQTPSTSRQDYFGGDIPFVSPADIYGQRYISHTQVTLTDKGATRVRILPVNTILVTCIGGLGKVGQAKTSLATNQQINSLIPNDRLNPAYGFWVAHLLKSQLDVIAGLQVVPIVNKRLFSQLLLPCPPFSQQRTIAEILDTIDTQIQQTEQLIVKLKQVKVGLLHDLLTLGIDENGDIRDPLIHPEEFKKTVLAKVPQKWKVSTLGDVVHSNGGLIQTGPFGSQLHAHEYVHEGIPVIMPQVIENERINTCQIARITPTKAAQLARHAVKFNDVIFGRRGDLDRCAFIDLSEVDFICGTDCLLVRPPKKLIDGRWLAAIYRHHRSQAQIRAKAVGSIMLGLNSTLLAKLVIAVPPLSEQKAIMDKIATFTDDISIEESDLAKLKQIKKGLMHDLLTGHVRVTQLSAEREHLSI